MRDNIMTEEDLPK